MSAKLSPGRSRGLFARASAVGFLIVLCGCQRLERAKECRDVARAVNPVLASVDAERKKAPDNATSYRAIGISYDTLATKLEASGVKTKRMTEAVADYVRVLREGGRDARLFADALAAKDQNKVNFARASAMRTERHESGAQNRFDSLCRTR